MNEALLIASALADLGLVALAFSRGRAWLYASIVLNLLLIAVLGQKIIPVWGFATNIGNVYYAGVFFAMYLLLEYHSRIDAIRALWIGVTAVVSFSILLQLSLGMESTPDTATISAMMGAVFLNTSRFALASLAGFLAAQSINISLYLPSREEPENAHWWIRVLVLMMAGQLVDSVIFFTIAFWGVIAAGTVVESMFVGYVMKVAIGAISIPFIRYGGTLKSPD